MHVQRKLEEIKKEAIPSPSEPPEWQKVTDDIAKRLEKCLVEKTAIEQKIKARIKQLEKWEHDPNSAIAIRINELRKLLSPS